MIIFSRLFLLIFLLSAFILMPLTSFAKPLFYKLDKTHTQILFFVDHLGFSKSEGEFLDFEGGFTFDEDNPENSKVHVIINANSITMDDFEWTQHLKNADFLDVPMHPEIEFKSRRVSITGDRKAEVVGDLTLRGITKPILLDVQYNKTGIHPKTRQEIAGFSATGMFKRSDFEMFFGLPHIGDEVELRLEIEGVR